MEKKSFTLLRNILYILLAFVFVILPIIFGILEGDFEVIGFPMLALGIWLLLFGKIKIASLSIEGRQAFAVGGALILPAIIMAAQHQLLLWLPLRVISVIAGLILAVVLYFVVDPTAVSKERYTLLAVLVAGLVSYFIGDAIGPENNGLYLQAMGFMGILGGIFGLIFGGVIK